MGLLDSIGDGMSGMLQTPDGQEMVKKFLSSPGGQNMVISNISTPEGRQFFGTLLLGIVDKLGLSPDQKKRVWNIAESQLQPSSRQVTGITLIRSSTCGPEF